MATAVREYGSKVRAAISSPREFKKFLEAREVPENGKADFNEDLLPTPPDKRSWAWIHFFTYYLTTTFSPTSYNLGSSLVANGLLWWHGMIAASVGSVFLSAIVIFQSRGATRYHVGFPVYFRAAAGPRGSKFMVFIRGAVATVFFSTNVYYGGRLTAVCLRCIFGEAWDNIPNNIPASMGITSANMLAFFIYWFLQMGLMFVHPIVLRHIFVIKAFYSTIALFSILGWAVAQNGGSLGAFQFTGQNTLSGADLAWPMISAINSVMAALCPILINQPDIARYAKRPAQATWSQAIGIVISKVLVMFISTATTSATTPLLGKSFWNVWDLYDAILTKYWSPGARAGIFFGTTGMVLAILATNAGTNALPAGADMAGLVPRYITIVRGQIIVGLLAPLFFPWKIIASSTTFLTFLSSYTVFLMPMCGIMIVDYFIVRKGNIHVPSLYSRDPETPYWYYKGWNFRAMLAWVCGTGFLIHGVAGALSPSSTNADSKHMYAMGFVLSFLMAAMVYYVSCLLYPPPVYPTDRQHAPTTFEYMADSEGFFAGETVEGIRGLLEGNVLEEVSSEKDPMEATIEAKAAEAT
ncbi:hypothetical protein GQ53DRAFT_845013 [Thozetella sp. PMI_491]|nr:hypothetical protein GQ53DRAFT_845013 [Thozetella sp. PMI_491]